MYKNTDELRKNNPNIYATVIKIFDKLHDPETGFRGLEHSLLKKLSPDDREKYKYENDTNTRFRLHKNKIIINKINEFETLAKNYNQAEFEDAVLQELLRLGENPEKYMKEHNIEGEILIADNGSINYDIVYLLGIC